MIQAQYFIDGCRSNNYDFFTGVPCSFLKPLINQVIDDRTLNYITASSEGEAVGIAAGAHLAGLNPVVMCQNSGLGNMVNPLSSLCYPFKIPLLLIVTLRGEVGLKDERQHELMGRITTDLLDLLKIHWRFFPEEIKSVNTIFNWARETMAETELPVALIMKKGAVAEKKRNHPASSETLKKMSDNHYIEGNFKYGTDKRIKRFDAIKLIIDLAPNDTAVIATTGKIGRELFSVRDADNHLYVVGSMGCASSIGFGVQQKNTQPVIVLDGDGAALMKLGTIATIGHYRPEQFLHIILDNETYESTGSQPTISNSIDFCAIASACGYRRCFRADNKRSLTYAIKESKLFKGPAMIHVKVSRGSPGNLGRPTIGPRQVKERFINFIKDRK